mmetsp:Transcript_9688/g.15981  ORF Transcript_9688/g.15981 Transcript_9688/m.15981 type:complete len:200 (-) Transcript_9688:231-830(-)
MVIVKTLDGTIPLGEFLRLKECLVCTGKKFGIDKFDHGSTLVAQLIRPVALNCIEVDKLLHERFYEDTVILGTCFCGESVKSLQIALQHTVHPGIGSCSHSVVLKSGGASIQLAHQDIHALADIFKLCTSCLKFLRLHLGSVVVVFLCITHRRVHLFLFALLVLLFLLLLCVCHFRVCCCGFRCCSCCCYCCCCCCCCY